MARHTLRVTVEDGAELVDVLKAIVATGVQVDEVRETTSPDQPR